MARPKTRNTKTVNFNLDLEVLAKLEQYCKETGLTKTAAIERILDKHLIQYFSNKQDSQKL